MRIGPLFRFQWEMKEEWRNKINGGPPMEEECLPVERAHKLPCFTVLAGAASPLKFIPVCQAFPLGPYFHVMPGMEIPGTGSTNQGYKD